MSFVDQFDRKRRLVYGFAVAVLVATVAMLFLDLPGSDIVTVGFLERTLQRATPIALAAIGGLYAEKSGVFNIGLEGFMIFGAFFGVAFAVFFGGDGGQIGQGDLWLALFAAALVCGVMTVVFAVLLIEFDADQIVAGLAVWFIGLGFAPFIGQVLWGSVNQRGVPNVDNVSVPVLEEIPVLGRLLFDVSPLVLGTIALAVVSWVVLYRTRYGYWVQAAGENPEALDTAGVDVNKVRYATTIFSGVMAGIAGAVLTIGIGSGFIGTGQTSTGGRGWIAIVAYLFGNYNPLGAFGASLLFGAADMLQIQFQTAGIALPASITGLFPYVAVLIVLTAVGYTRVPSAVGESYETED